MPDATSFQSCRAANRAVCLIVCLVAGALAAPAGAQAPGPSGGGPADLRGRIVGGLRPMVRVVNGRDTTYTLADRMRYYQVAGVSIAVIDGGRVVWAEGFGTTEAGGTQRVDTTTLFQAASISKPVFATAALALVHEGRLALDADVNRQLRSWRLPVSVHTAEEKVTLRRFLSHTAGLTVSGFGGYAAGVAVPTVLQARWRTAGQQRARAVGHRPGRVIRGTRDSRRVLCGRVIPQDLDTRTGESGDRENWDRAALIVARHRPAPNGACASPRLR